MAKYINFNMLKQGGRQALIPGRLHNGGAAYERGQHQRGGERRWAEHNCERNDVKSRPGRCNHNAIQPGKDADCSDNKQCGRYIQHHTRRSVSVARRNYQSAIQRFRGVFREWPSYFLYGGQRVRHTTPKIYRSRLVAEAAV